MRRPVIAALARCRPLDIDEAARALEPAERKRIHTFLATSDLHLEAQAAHHARAVPRADRRQRAARPQLHRRCGVFGGGCDAQRSRLPLPGRRSGDQRRRDDDQPAGHGRLRRSRTRCATSSRKSSAACPNSDKAIFSTHCHDDLGLAVANSLAAIQGGVRQIECTINGIGERAGNASLEEIVMALRVRQDRLPYDTAINTPLLFETSQLLSQAHRRTGAVEQGDRRPQRVRARSRHSPGRDAEGLADLRDHAAAGRRAERRSSWCSAATPAVTRSASAPSSSASSLTTDELAQVYHAVITMGEHRKSIGDNDLRRMVERVRSGQTAQVQDNRDQQLLIADC